MAESQWYIKMRKIISILYFLLMGNLYADTLALYTQAQLMQYAPLKENEGEKLIPLEKVMLADVHPAIPVKYFDIKSYNVSDRGVRREDYVTGWSFDQKVYATLTKEEKVRIRSVKPVMSRTPFGATYFPDSPMKTIYNLHYVDMHSKVHTLVSRKELLHFLGTIDTPAEVHMALLNFNTDTIRYRQKGDLYIIATRGTTYEDYDSGDFEYTISVGHLIMDKNGKILLSKSMKSLGCRDKKCREIE